MRRDDRDIMLGRPPSENNRNCFFYNVTSVILNGVKDLLVEPPEYKILRSAQNDALEHIFTVSTLRVLIGPVILEQNHVSFHSQVRERGKG